MFIGFASATAGLNINEPKLEKKKATDLTGLESLNILMIISRALFALQYFIVLVLLGRKHKPAKTPLIIISVIYLFSSAIYGVLFKFILIDGKTQSVYGYYAIIIFELLLISFITYRYDSLSFKDTHLHKRLMILTLMILGEGVIVCAFSFAKIGSKSKWTPNSFGQALCVILSIVSRPNIASTELIQLRSN
jgi:hypothetical protein